MEPNSKLNPWIPACLLALLALIWAAPAGAWTMTLDNPTEYTARVLAYGGYKDPIHLKTLATVNIAPGGSYQWSTGAQCPTGFAGKLNTPDGWRGLKTDTFIKCWNVHYKICQKAGQGYTEVRDYDYGFCKN